MWNLKPAITSDYNEKAADTGTETVVPQARRGMGRGDTEAEGWEAQTVTHRINYKSASNSNEISYKDASYSTGIRPVFYKNYEWNATFKGWRTHCTAHL